MFLGNPLEEELTEQEEYNYKVVRTLKPLEKLDGFPVIREDGAQQLVEDEDSDDASDLDEELYNDPLTQVGYKNISQISPNKNDNYPFLIFMQEIIKTLVL